MRAAKCQILLLALIALAGCQRKQQPSLQIQPVTIEVITDAVQVDAARKAWADEREQKLAALLQEPEQINSFDKESVALVKQQRDRSVAALTALRDDASKSASMRIDAIMALKLLDVPPAPALLAQLALSGNEAALSLLQDLDQLYEDGERIPDPIKQFVVTSLNNREPRVRDLAMHRAAWKHIDEASAIIAARIRTEPKPDRALLQAAANLCPSVELLQLLQKQLKPMSMLEGGTIGMIADLGRSTKDPALQQQAARVCVDYLKRQADQPWMDGNLSSAMALLRELQPPESARTMLTELVRSAKWQLLRKMALGQLQELDEPAARKLATETGLQLSSDDETTATKPKRTVDEIAAICTRHGILTPAEADRALAELRKAAAAQTNSSGQGVEAVLECAGRFLAFDTETGMLPNRHDLLLADFAKASGGHFNPEAALEQYADSDTDKKDKKGDWVESGQGEYTVQFVHGGKLYRFKPNDLGDWYDVTAVVKAIHRALEDAGIADRFMLLDGGGGQDAAFCFAKPDALKAAAPELELKLGEDPDAARKSGKAAEERVLKELKK